MSVATVPLLSCSTGPTLSSASPVLAPAGRPGQAQLQGSRRHSQARSLAGAHLYRGGITASGWVAAEGAAGGRYLSTTVPRVRRILQGRILQGRSNPTVAHSSSSKSSSRSSRSSSGDPGLTRAPARCSRRGPQRIPSPEALRSACSLPDSHPERLRPLCRATVRTHTRSHTADPH